MTGVMGDVTGVLPGLLDATVKGSVLLLVVIAAAWALREAAAATRHRLWAAGMVAMLGLPVVSTLVPWRLEVFPLPAWRAEWAGEISVVEQGGAERLMDPVSQPPAEVRFTKPSRGTTVSEGPVPDQPGADRGANAAAAGASKPGGAVPFSNGRSLATLLAVAWLCGVMVALLRLAQGWYSAGWIVASAEAPEDAFWGREVSRISRRLGLSRSVRLVKTDRIRLAFTTGLFRPVVVLPAGCADWSADRRRAVLLHELAHVRRGDLVVQLVSSLARAVYWFNPLVWLAARRLRAEGERAADDTVLIMGTRASSYAGDLLDMVRSARAHRAPATVLPMAQESDFEGRLLAILAPDARRGTPSAWAKAGIAIVIAVSAFPLAALSPVGAGVDGGTGAREPGPTVGGREQEAVPTREALPEAQTAHESVRPEPPAASDQQRTVDLPLEPLVELANPDDQEAEIGPVVAALVGALRDPAPEVRREAARALADRQDTASVAALARALRTDTDAEVRAMCAYSLGELGSPSGVPPLVEALGADAASEVRARAAWALGEIADPGAVSGLVTALRDASPEVRQQAAWALGEIQEPEAVDGLVGALSDEQPEVREQAAWALGEIADARALDGLMATADDPDADVRGQALWALAEVGDPRAEPAFIRLLGDPEPGIRQRAVVGLTELDLEAAPDALLAAASDESAEVRRRVAWALEDIADPASVPVLRELLGDPEAEVRKAALRALAEIGDPGAIDAMIQALQDEDSEVRQEAARALGGSDGVDLRLR